jgi:tetratricopeptide (TPR) repeat protein
VQADSGSEVPEVIPAAVPDPMRDLLKEGETAFNANDISKAKATFERVLAEFDATNGAALYGLALLASKEGDSETARQYFDGVVRSQTAEPGMKVWSYIFMARIFDLECDRTRALEYYQLAIQVGDNTRNAQAVAGEGLKTPYGDACR